MVVDFLFSHNMLLRGEARRQLELPDVFTIPLSNEGPTLCWQMRACTECIHCWSLLVKGTFLFGGMAAIGCLHDHLPPTAGLSVR